MRKFLFFIPALIITFSSCNTAATKFSSGLLSTDSLPTENFTIDINKDTLLQTLNGAWIKIDKGTFTADKDKVVLEIKEAFSIQQIIKAGLTTQANGEPLASGGMICVNAAAGQKVSINKPFRVAVPSGYLEKNMQLYKGAQSANGTTNWKDPKSLDENLQQAAIQKGAQLFQQKCSTCHGIGKEGSGPDLANLYKRFPHYYGEGGYMGYEHYFKKIYYPYQVEHDGTDRSKGRYLFDEGYADAYICNLIKAYGNKAIDLSDDFNKNNRAWKNIYDYVENESNRLNLPYPRHAYLDSCIDSCNRYKRIKSELEEKKAATETRKANLLSDTHPLVVRKGQQNQQQPKPAPPPEFDATVVPGDNPAIYYQFTIESFGWYNIDVLLKQRDGVQESQLFVRIAGSYREKINIYLIIPAFKILLEGGPAEKNNDEYAFDKKNGSIPLPQNSKAYILAVTETGDSMAFALKEFTTQTKQQLDISLNIATKQAFNKAIESIGADGLNITVKDGKNAAAIREANKTIKELEEELKNAENLKPTRCDCDCGALPVAAVPASTEATVNSRTIVVALPENPALKNQ